MRALLMVHVIVAVVGSFAAVGTADDDVHIRKVFIMAEGEDGKRFKDSFEVWDTVCSLRPSPTLGAAKCSITAVSLTESRGQTHVFTWRHDSQTVREVQPGVYRIDLNGRLSDCSGLQVIIRLDKLYSEVESIEGEMRSGTRCQSKRTYSLDTTTPSRAVLPIRNPAFLLLFSAMQGWRMMSITRAWIWSATWRMPRSRCRKGRVKSSRARPHRYSENRSGSRPA